MDVVNNHGGRWDRYPTMVKACRQASGPFVQSFHAANHWGERLEKPLRTLKLASAVTVASMALRTYYEPLLPRARDAAVIADGVDCAAADAAEPYRRERPYIFCACPLELSQNAVNLLVSSFAIVAPQYPQVDLLIGGDGKDAAQLVDQIEAAELEKRTELLGTTEPAETWRLYKGSLLFAMPTWRPETESLVFLEAMAAGKPVIGTNRGASAENILPGKTGLLVENDPRKLASALRVLLDNPELRTQMGEHARTFAAQFDWSRVAERYLEVYAACSGGQLKNGRLPPLVVASRSY